MPTTLNELITARKRSLQEQKEEAIRQAKANKKDRQEEGVKSFSESYPELVSLPEFEWKPDTKFIDRDGFVDDDIAFSIGNITFDVGSQSAGECTVCPKCGVFRCSSVRLRNDDILDYIIAHPDGNEKMDGNCFDCRMEENRTKASEPKEVPQYPRTVEEKVYVHVQEILYLLDIPRTEN